MLDTVSRRSLSSVSPVPSAFYRHGNVARAERASRVGSWRTSIPVYADRRGQQRVRMGTLRGYPLGGVGLWCRKPRRWRASGECLATASAELSPRRDRGPAGGTGEIEFRSALLAKADAVAVFEAARRAANHVRALISASACSSQNRMSMSRYIVMAVVRCSQARSRLSVRW